jgi:hypothetical protein
MAGKMELNDSGNSVEYAIGKYKEDKRPFKASQPRDLLRLIRNKFYYFGSMDKTIESKDVDEAYAIYFPKDIVY